MLKVIAGVASETPEILANQTTLKLPSSGLKTTGA